MSVIRTDVRGDHLTLEQSLRKQGESSNRLITRQLSHIPLAFHHYFWEVSNNYTSEAINYSVLLNKTIGADIDTAFVTVNYDTLLEQSITKIMKEKFIDLSSYYTNGNWLLIKLHGSVGWGVPWDSDPAIGSATSALETFGVPDIKANRIRIGINRDLQRSVEPQTYYYPAMVLPVEDKYGFLCPNEHIDAFRTFLLDCRNFLFVGFSAKDRDLLDFLKLNIPQVAPNNEPGVTNLGIVTGDDSETHSVLQRLSAVTVQFRNPLYPTKLYNKGFSDFLRRSIDPFLRDVWSSVGQGVF